MEERAVQRSPSHCAPESQPQRLLILPLGVGCWEHLDPLQGSLYTPIYPLIHYPNILYLPEGKGKGRDLFLALYVMPGKQVCSLRGDDGQEGIGSQGRSVCLFGGGGVRSARSPESSWEDLYLFMKSKKGNMLAPIPNLMPKPIYCVFKGK